MKNKIKQSTINIMLVSGAAIALLFEFVFNNIASALGMYQITVGSVILMLTFRKVSQ